MIREIEVGDQVRVKETGEIGLVRHIMFYKPFHFFRGKKLIWLVRLQEVIKSMKLKFLINKLKEKKN